MLAVLVVVSFGCRHLRDDDGWPVGMVVCVSYVRVVAEDSRFIASVVVRQLLVRLRKLV